jgi:hypothetical protein
MHGPRAHPHSNTSGCNYPWRMMAAQSALAAREGATTTSTAPTATATGPASLTCYSGYTCSNTKIKLAVVTEASSSTKQCGTLQMDCSVAGSNCKVAGCTGIATSMFSLDAASAASFASSATAIGGIFVNW